MNRSVAIILLALGCLGTAAVGWTLAKGRTGPEVRTSTPRLPVSSLPQKRTAGITGDYREIAESAVALRGERSIDEIAKLLRGARRSTKLGADPVALAILMELGNDEIASLLPELLETDPRADALIAAAIGRWAETEPYKAIEWAEAKLDRPGFAAARSAIVAAWATNEPLAATAWLREQLANAPRKGRYQIESDFNTLVNLWARDDPAAALQAVIDQEQPGTYSKWWGFSQLVKHDDRRDEAFDLVLGIEDEPVRLKGLESLVGAWADDHPQAAAAWLDAEDYKDKRTQWSVSQRFARADPEANADWILERSTDETRESSVNTAIAYWVRSDPGAAETWIEKNSLVDDRTAGQLAHGWATRDPKRAIGWARRLEEEEKQMLMIGDVLNIVRNRAYNKGVPLADFDFEPYTGATGTAADELSKLTDEAQQRSSRRW